jgi:predicted RNase H-like nuclease (RuvC/YqgF family)
MSQGDDMGQTMAMDMIERLNEEHDEVLSENARLRAEVDKLEKEKDQVQGELFGEVHTNPSQEKILLEIKSLKYDRQNLATEKLLTKCYRERLEVSLLPVGDFTFCSQCEYIEHDDDIETVGDGGEHLCPGCYDIAISSGDIVRCERCEELFSYEDIFQYSAEDCLTYQMCDTCHHQASEEYDESDEILKDMEKQ